MKHTYTLKERARIFTIIFCLSFFAPLMLLSQIGTFDPSEYTLIHNYDFGTSATSTIKNLTDLENSFNPYGVAGTTVINEEWQRYKPFNTTNHHFTTNALELRADTTLGGVFPGGISSGQIVSHETFHPNNGNTYAFVLRAKIPEGDGLWPAYWMYCPGGGVCTNSEIDIFEFYDNADGDTYDWSGGDLGAGTGPLYYDITNEKGDWHPGFNFADDFHEYILIWKEGRLERIVDSTFVKGSFFDWLGGHPEVLINLALGGPNYDPTVNGTPWPAIFELDYFRVYEKPATGMTVTITSPGQEEIFMEGEDITITAEASHSNGSIMQVEFFDGITSLGIDTSPPYSATLNNILPGTHGLTAVSTANDDATEIGVPVIIPVWSKEVNGNVTTIRLNQQVNGGTMNSLGTYTFDAGNAASVTIRTDGTDGYVVADAVKLSKSGQSDIIMDSEDASGVSISGSWTSSTFTPGYLGGEYKHDGNSGKGSKSITYTPNLPVSGDWTVSMQWVSGGNRASNVPVDIDDGLDDSGLMVSITNPADGAVFTQGDTIVVSAEAADSAGTVTQVEFFEGTNSLGIDTSSPYSITWNNVEGRTYALRAVATDNDDNTKTSDPVQIVVNYPLPVNPVRLVVKHSNMALTIADSSTSDDGNIIQKAYSGGDDQQWNIQPAEGGYYSVVNVHSGKALEVAGASTSNGANVQQGTYEGSHHQQWAIEDVGDGYVRLTARHSGKALDVQDASLVDGANVQQWEYDGSTHKQWKIESGDIDTTTTVFVNQTQNGGIWNSLGSFTFNAGTAGSVKIRTDGTNGYVVADAIKFSKSGQSDIILDSEHTTGINFAGSWTTSTYDPGFLGSNYKHDGNAGKGSKRVTYTPDLPVSGEWTVAMIWSAASNRASNVPVDIIHSDGSSVNTPPIVSITSPSNGAVFTDGENITMSADAADSDGSIIQVAFFEGVNSLGIDTTAPYSVMWNNVTIGSYSLTAVATDEDNETTTSDPISITVNSSAGGGTTTTVFVDQTQNGSTWNSLGSFTFNAGSSGSVKIRTNGTNNYVIADAVKFSKSGEADIILDSENSSGISVVGNWPESSYSPDYIGTNYRHDGHANKGYKSVTYTPYLPASGEWTVSMFWNSGIDRASNVPVDITHASEGSGGSTATLVNNGNYYSIVNSATEDEMIVYPNPLESGDLIIHYAGQVNKDTYLKITNLLGEEVFSVQVAESPMYVDKSNLSPGIFMVHVVSNGQKISTAKLIIE